MFGLIKIAGLSAVLAAGVVGADLLPKALASVPVSQKAFTDRLLPSDTTSRAAKVEIQPRFADLALRGTTGAGKGDRLRGEPGEGCAAQAWPNISQECLVSIDGTPIRKAVRTITLETREGANVSVLARVPVTEVAGR